MKRAIVTGASAGIGFETAKGLALRGYAVHLTGRNPLRTRESAERIRVETGNERVRAYVADFATLAGVRELAEALCDEAPKFHLLVNNAGLWMREYARTRDGFEMTHAVNHLAPTLLTHLLLPALVHDAPSRIVFVSSTVHRNVGPYDFAGSDPRGFRGIRAYGQSKLANVLTAFEFARRFRQTGRATTCSAVHPGAVQTKIVRYNAFLSSAIRLAGPWIRTPAEGAETTLYAACEPSLANVSGAYFSDCRQIPASPHAREESAALRLWRQTNRDLGLSEVHPSVAGSAA
ncbi:MAG: SDR family NAD(P)-dependent oxidoreductase [Myxococcota bacterium]